MDSNEFIKFRKNYMQTKYYSVIENIVEFDSNKLENIFCCSVYKNIKSFNLFQIKNLFKISEFDSYHNTQNKPTQSKLDIFDDELQNIKIRRNFNLELINYQNQKYIYINCRIYNIFTLNYGNAMISYIINLEIINIKIKNYLLDLIKNISLDIEELHEKNKKRHHFDFNHNFTNSLGYPKINKNSEFVLDSPNLCYHFNIEPNDVC